MSEPWEVRAERAITSAHFFLNEGSDAEIPPAASEAWHIIHDMRDVIAEALTAGRSPLSPEIREALEHAAKICESHAHAQLGISRVISSDRCMETAAKIRSFLSVSTEGLK